MRILVRAETDRGMEQVWPWMSPKEKLVIAVLMIISIVTAVSLLKFIPSDDPSSIGEGFYYSDLVSQKGSTCWEANVFAAAYDPFYKWILSSSLATTFTKKLPIERATVGYQRASVWRISGKKEKDNTTTFYNAPDPRLLGGVIRRSGGWIWKMTINWGLSVRLCIHMHKGGLDNTCLKTTPLVWTKEDEFALLMVSVPYRKASTNVFLEKNPYVSYGSYLTNFASNARTEMCIAMNRTSKRGAYWRYIYPENQCNKASPIVQNADVISYLAFPSLQCGCSGQVCFVGGNLTYNNATDDGLSFKLNTTACQSTKSFWRFSESPDSNFTFFSYNPKWDLSLTLNVAFASSLEQLESSGWKPLSELSSCVSGWLGNQKRRPVARRGAVLIRYCSRPEVVLTPYDPDGNVFVRHQIMHLNSTTQIMEAKVPVELKPDVYCGIDPGQVSRDVCTLHLSEVHTQNQVKVLLNNLEDFAKVADIRGFGEKEWKKSSSRRSDVSIEIATTLLTFVVTIAGMLSRKVQRVEDAVLKRVSKFKDWINRTVGMPMLRTFIRGGVIFFVAIWNMFDLYKCIQDIKSSRELATSGTILQQSSGISFLVTTTSNIQVSPNWFAFKLVCCTVGVFMVSLLLYIYSLMAYIEWSSAEQDQNRQTERHSF